MILNESGWTQREWFEENIYQIESRIDHQSRSNQPKLNKVKKLLKNICELAYREMLFDYNHQIFWMDKVLDELESKEFSINPIGIH